MYKTILNEIKKYESIVIFRHENPDGDALGSSFGLKEFIKVNFPNKKVYVSNKEKATLNGIFPLGDKITKEIIKKSLIIIVDTANVSRISGIDWDKGLKIIKIDHHPNIDKYGDFQLVEPKKASTAEIITNFITLDPTFKISKNLSKYLFTGIVTDTGSFRYSSVTANTFAMVSILLRDNFKVNKIHEQLFVKTEDQTRYHGYVLTNYKVIGKVAYFIASKNIEDKFNLDYSYVSSAVWMIMGAENVKYAIYSTWDKNNQVYKVSLRSKRKAINQIAEQFGGGGHPQASGLRIKNKKEFKLVLNELKKL